MARLGAALLLVMTLTAAAVLFADGTTPSPSPPQAQAAPPTQLTCDALSRATTVIARRRDAVLGPFVLIGARQTPGRSRDAFDRRGYKIPVTLPEGVSATLSVPATQRRRVGLVYSLAAQDAVETAGLRGAESAVQFVACDPEDEPGRSGWPGGIVVDRPRCVTFIVKVADRPSQRHRVPLGRRC